VADLPDGGESYGYLVRSARVNPASADAKTRINLLILLSVFIVVYNF
jgi:hypothetical protein